MQVMNSRLSFEEIKAITEAAKVGILAHRHTFQDGPDQQERIVLQTEATKKNIFGHPVWKWSDVITLDDLRGMVAAAKS